VIFSDLGARVIRIDRPGHEERTVLCRPAHGFDEDMECNQCDCPRFVGIAHPDDCRCGIATITTVYNDPSAPSLGGERHRRAGDRGGLPPLLPGVCSSDTAHLHLVITLEDEPGAADVAELAEGLHRVLTALILRVHRRNRSRLTIGDLTVAQRSILLTLRVHGRIRMKKLSVVERVRTPSLSVAIRRLETLGLVKRSRDAADLRLVYVELTPRDSAVQRESLANHQAYPVTRLLHRKMRQCELRKRLFIYSQAERDAVVDSATTVHSVQTFGWKSRPKFSTNCW
jgi:DNA-binding MarR family transcriptional regulator